MNNNRNDIQYSYNTYYGPYHCSQNFPIFISHENGNLFVDIVELIPKSILRFFSYFTNEEIQIFRGYVTCRRSLG